LNWPGNRMTTGPRPALHRVEFIALIAMLFATVALAIDAMLPAMPAIATAFSPNDPDRAGLVISTFVFGMGLGTFVAGPISDQIGRKATILSGLVLFMLGAALAANAWSLQSLLAARVLMGLGAAGPRVASMALVRDMFSGREMAQIMSFVMMVFMIVPAAAPAMGAVVIAGYGWRGVFWTFLVFAVVVGAWITLRQPETLPRANRRPLRLRTLWTGTQVVLTNRIALASIVAQTVVYSALFGTLASVQPIFAQTFDKAATFPAWFALIALFSSVGSLTNALLVRRLGMLRVIVAVFAGMLVLSAIMAVLTFAFILPPQTMFVVFFVWVTSVFAMAGMTIGNLNALAMEPMGAIAGLAASVILAVPTVLGAAIAAPLGLAFDGTPGPLAFGITIGMAVALLITPQLRAR
jgi:MFS transporter, DHA1 family, multidrug resistance protein